MDPAHETDSTFVGRERELEALASGLHDAASGRPRYFLVTGDAGIGKTRTVEELIRRTRLPEARVLWCRVPEQAGAPSYWPWIRALEHHATRGDARTLQETLAGDGPVLAYLVPAIRQRCPEVEPAPPQGGDMQARFALLDAVTSFLRRAAAADPLLLFSTRQRATPTSAGWKTCETRSTRRSVSTTSSAPPAPSRRSTSSPTS